MTTTSLPLVRRVALLEARLALLEQGADSVLSAEDRRALRAARGDLRKGHTRRL